jgi:hypothetical protein
MADQRNKGSANDFGRHLFLDLLTHNAPQLFLPPILDRARDCRSLGRVFRIYRRVAAGVHIPYTDKAMTPVSEDETQTLELVTYTKSARRSGRSCPKDQDTDRCCRTIHCLNVESHHHLQMLS